MVDLEPRNGGKAWSRGASVALAGAWTGRPIPGPVPWRCSTAIAPTPSGSTSNSPTKGFRFSFMGDASGPLATTVTYGASTRPWQGRGRGETEVRPSRSSTTSSARWSRPRASVCSSRHHRDSPLRVRLRARPAPWATSSRPSAGGSPPTLHPYPTPPWSFADRMVAFDHEQNHIYLLSFCQPGEEAASEAWLSATAASLEPGTPSAPRWTRGGEGSAEPPCCCSRDHRVNPGARTLQHPCTWARSHAQYLADIAACESRRLLDGETYEICLTNVRRGAPTRSRSTACCAASTRRRSPPTCGSATSPCSAPRPSASCVDRDGMAEARPIKGTGPRGATPAEDARLAEELRARREEPRREPDDRRPAAQRPRPRLRDRHGRRCPS